MTPTLFHPGYSKAGSAFLQRFLFGEAQSGLTAIYQSSTSDTVERPRKLSRQLDPGDDGHIPSLWDRIPGRTGMDCDAGGYPI